MSKVLKQKVMRAEPGDSEEHGNRQFKGIRTQEVIKVQEELHLKYNL